MVVPPFRFGKRVVNVFNAGIAGRWTFWRALPVAKNGEKFA